MQDFLYKIVFALIAGLSEFLPVSAPAHYSLYEYVTNQKMDPLVVLAAHLGCLVACVVCCRKRIKRMQKEQKILARARRNHSRKADAAVLMDRAILRAGMVPVLLGYFFYRSAAQWVHSIAILAALLLCGGVLVFLPSLFARGNKDGRSLSRMDGLFMGIVGMLGAVPGFSRIGGICSMGSVRGADKSYVAENALVLSIPALAAMVGIDIYTLFVGSVAVSGIGLLICLLAVAVSFGSAYLAIAILRHISGKADLSNFAYYSWGLALFVFLIYLIIH